MNSPGRFTLLVLPAAVALVACSSSSTNGSGSTGSSGPTVASSGTSSSGGAGIGTKLTGQALADQLNNGVANVTSAHIEIVISAEGQNVTASGDEQVDHGKLLALHLNETLPNNLGSIELITVDGQTYAKLPADKSPTVKPWVLVTADSSNEEIRTLAGSLQQSESSASLNSTTAFVSAASSVVNKGAESVDGVNTTHYSVAVDPSKLPDDNPGKAALVEAGVTSLPLELYIDDQGRPVKVTENFTTQGEAVSTTVQISKYNQPVSIQAPPADQVGTG